MIPKIHNRTNEYIGDLTECSRGIAIEERNGMLEIEIDYHLDSPYSSDLIRGNIIIADVNDNLKQQQFRIYKVTKDIRGNFTVYASHISYDIARDFTEGITIIENTCENCLNELFLTSKFSQKFVGHSNITTPQTFTITPRNLLNAISGSRGSIIDTFGNGAEILRDNYDFYVLNKRGTDNGVTIEYANNLTGLNYEEDETGLITCIRAFATYVDESEIEQTIHTYVTSDKAQNYETLFISEIDFSEKFAETIPTIERLKTLAENYFKNNECDVLDYNYKVEFIPLSKCAGYENIQDEVGLCDTVTIIDSRYGLNYKSKVIKTTYDFLKERYESMELGTLKNTSLMDSATSDKIDEILNNVGAHSVKFEILDNKIKSSVASLEGEIETTKTTIEQTSEEIKLVASDMNEKYSSLKLSVDSIDLTGFVTFESLEEEGQTTINGANIATGTITADQISVGTITADEIKAGTITGGNIADQTIGTENIATGAITKELLAVDCLQVGNITQASSQDKAYIKLFNTMSLDGSSGAIRLQYDANNYIYIDGGQFEYYSSSGGSSSPTWAFYGGTSTQTMYTSSNVLTVNSSGLKITNGGFNSTGTSNLSYIKCSGNMTVGDVYASSLESSGYVYCDNLDDYGGSGITMRTALNGNSQNLGYSGSKFYQLSAEYVWGDNGSVSDEKFKENIRYIKKDKKRDKTVLAYDTNEVKKQNQNTKKYNKENLIKDEDFYNFIRDELDICEYNYIHKEGEKYEKDFIDKIGLIANDYVESKIGSKIVGYTSEEFYALNTNNLLFVTAGALQYEALKRDAEIKDLEYKINNLENKLNSLKKGV